MELCIKRFDELTVNELFEIYKLRVSVFIVEQNCPYQEADEFDRSALHLTLRENGKILAYARVLPAGTVFDEVSLGRVIAVERRKGYGSLIVSEALKAAREYFGAERVVIEAQTYARGLYEKLGFVQISDEFSEDGIPHIKMLKIF
ncbi:MAG: GNAT family N-acetyltransferase [Eubacteriales bacterium]|nr:GNAT family N-acetyltransferase [Eubacteriales bacterium]